MNAALLRDVSKAPVTLIVIEIAAVCASYEQVQQAIIVVVAPVSAHAQMMQLEPCAFGDIGECAVSIVVEEPVPHTISSSRTKFGRLVHHIQIGETVVVIIAPR